MSADNSVAGGLSFDEKRFKAYVVYLILSKNTEKAVELISRKHKVPLPRLSIGISKGKKRALGVYSVESNAISFKDQDQFFNPFVVLHEMYHCVRSSSGSHRGNEKNADRFALDYITCYNELARTAAAASDDSQGSEIKVDSKSMPEVD